MLNFTTTHTKKVNLKVEQLSNKQISWDINFLLTFVIQNYNNTIITLKSRCSCPLN